MTEPATTPAVIAAMLKELVDVLLPGDGRFPAASDAGTHGLVADRLMAQTGESALDDLAQTLADCGGPLSPLSREERQAVVRRMEETQPEQFETLRMVSYLALITKAPRWCAPCARSAMSTTMRRSLRATPWPPSTRAILCRRPRTGGAIMSGRRT